MFLVHLRNHAIILRRLIAAVLLLCVGLLTFEQLSVEVCDESGARIVAHELENAAPFAGDDQGHVQASGNPQVPGSQQDVSHPGMHVCHCLHGHFSALPMRHVLTGEYLALRNTFDDLRILPPSVTLEPPHRPPLAVA